MITEQEYIEALHKKQECERVVELYKKEREAIRRTNLTDLEREQEDCDHHCLPSGGKWSSATQVTCCFCGKTFN